MLDFKRLAQILLYDFTAFYLNFKNTELASSKCIECTTSLLIIAVWVADSQTNSMEQRLSDTPAVAQLV